MKEHFQKLTDDELEKLLIETGSFQGFTTEAEKQTMRDDYRKAEAENIEQIKTAGSFEKWYASGVGRLLFF